jgi:proliferating cell nuclear antigen
MTKATIPEQLLREFIKVIGELTDEFRLKITKDGWNVAVVDPANVAMILVDLPKDNFLNYEFQEENWTSCIDGHPTGTLEDNIKVGIDVGKIKQFIPSIDGKIMVLTDEDRLPIECTFRQAEHGGYELILKQGMFSRTIALLPENSIRKAPVIPKLALDYKLQLNRLDLTRIVQRAEKVNDYIRFGFNRECTPEQHKMKFTATAKDDNDKPLTAEKYVAWQALRDGARDSSNSLYSLDYLTSMIPTIPSESAWLHLGQDYPLIMEFGIGQTGTARYMQAPRVETQ